MNGVYPALNVAGAMTVSAGTARSYFPLLAVFEYMKSFPRTQTRKVDTVLSIAVHN
jgi:hypothetical protein